MELTSLCGDDTMRLLEENGLAFPFSAYHLELGGVDVGGHEWVGLSTAPWPSPFQGG